MGRELKRVPMDFAWPLDKTWGGYLNPYYASRVDCPSCAGTGYAPMAKVFSDQWYGYVPFDPVAYGATPLTIDHPGVVALAKRNVEESPDFYGRGQKAIDAEARRLFGHWRGQWVHHLIQADVDALVAAHRLHDFTHVPRTEEQRVAVEAQRAAGGGWWMKEPNGYTPTADEVNAWSLSGMGHDSINSWVCVKARCNREGHEKTCRTCSGDGDMWSSPEAKASAEAWTATEPPKGDGYQLWQTTSEGSPVSPVFATLDGLCAWCADNATTFADYTASAERWKEMLGTSFVHHVEGNGVFL